MTPPPTSRPVRALLVGGTLLALLQAARGPNPGPTLAIMVSVGLAAVVSSWRSAKLCRMARPTARKPAPAAAPFTGFADARGDFFVSLALHNDREWFQAHREAYEAGWARPMAALLEAVRGRLGAAYRRRTLGAPRVFRLNRDVRFSKDKAPYKTHVAGWIPLEAGRPTSPMGAPAALYLQVGPLERFTGSGCWMLDPEALGRFRAALLDPRRGAALARHLARLEAQGFSRSSAEALVRPPAGVAPDHPRADLLRMKGLVVVPGAPPRRLLTRPELVDWLTERAVAAAPIVTWLADHVA